MKNQDRSGSTELQFWTRRDVTEVSARTSPTGWRHGHEWVKYYTIISFLLLDCAVCNIMIWFVLECSCLSDINGVIYLVIDASCAAIIQGKTSARGPPGGVDLISQVWLVRDSQYWLSLWESSPAPCRFLLVMAELFCIGSEFKCSILLSEVHVYTVHVLTWVILQYHKISDCCGQQMSQVEVLVLSVKLTIILYFIFIFFLLLLRLLPPCCLLLPL